MLYVTRAYANKTSHMSFMFMSLRLVLIMHVSLSLFQVYVILTKFISLEGLKFVQILGLYH
jgi:hypothetical protein